MLSGLPPFYHGTSIPASKYTLSFTDRALSIDVTDKMYDKILNDPLVFGPEIEADARSILTALLTRDPLHRLGVNGADEIKKHPFFGKHINFKKLLEKKIQPPFKPSVDSPVVRMHHLFFKSLDLNLFK